METEVTDLVPTMFGTAAHPGWESQGWRDEHVLEGCRDAPGYADRIPRDRSAAAQLTREHLGAGDAGLQRLETEGPFSLGMRFCLAWKLKKKIQFHNFRIPSTRPRRRSSVARPHPTTTAPRPSALQRADARAPVDVPLAGDAGLQRLETEGPFSLGMRFCLAWKIKKKDSISQLQDSIDATKTETALFRGLDEVPPLKFMHLVVRIASLQPPRVSCSCFFELGTTATSWNVQAHASKKKTAHKHLEIGGLHKFEK